MTNRTASAIASPNIALIKYWGNRDHSLRLPMNGSISMTLGGLETHTTVTFDKNLSSDSLILEDKTASKSALERVSQHLNHIRCMASIQTSARVESSSNFPADVGIASSASAFAALTLAGTTATGLNLAPTELSRIARLGSGSACRSIFGGYVEWYIGEGDSDSHAIQIAPPDHWKLIDLIAIVSREHKDVSSTLGHTIANTSPIQSARVADCPRRLDICRNAIYNRDFNSLAMIVEQDSNLMHAVMLTSTPSLLYWLPDTLEVMHAVSTWRKEGLNVFYTIDAGPNVHCICTEEHANQVEAQLRDLPGVIEILRAFPGQSARII